MCEICESNIKAREMFSVSGLFEEVQAYLYSALRNNEDVSGHIHVSIDAAHDADYGSCVWGVIVWADLAVDRCDHGHQLDSFASEEPAELWADGTWVSQNATMEQRRVSVKRCSCCGAPNCPSCHFELTAPPMWNTITPTPGVCVMEETKKLAITMSTEWEQEVADVNAIRRAKLVKVLRRAIKEAHGMTRDEYFEQVVGCWPEVIVDNKGTIIIWDEGQPAPHGASMLAAHSDERIVVTIEDLT